jgi:ArsR family metal-binding transcriptional regulator
MLLDNIDKVDIFRPKMHFTKEVLHAIATFQADISPVLPYLNAELGGWEYDQQNGTLMLKLTDGKWITLHAHQIAIRGIKDIEEAHALVAWIKGQINNVYERREQIIPRYTGQAGLKIIEIIKNLPMTNCKGCGYPTCMAYAAALREGETTPPQCHPLGEEKYQVNRQKLLQYLDGFGWRALDE